MTGPLFVGLLALFAATAVVGFNQRFGSLHLNYNNNLTAIEILSYSAKAEDRPFCEPLCTEVNSGCNTTTEYCAVTNTIGLGVGCCRTKLAGGEVCFPLNNGTDCMSGTCTNLLQPFDLIGITWNFGILNLFGGTCATCAVAGAACTMDSDCCTAAPTCTASVCST